MKILLDECVPWPISKVLRGHRCTNVAHHGWRGIRNGELLRRAEGEFDLFITCDQSIRYQQNLKGRKIAILEISTNKLRPIVAAQSELRSAIAGISPGQYRVLTLR